MNYRSPVCSAEARQTPLIHSDSLTRPHHPFPTITTTLSQLQVLLLYPMIRTGHQLLKIAFCSCSFGKLWLTLALYKLGIENAYQHHGMHQAALAVGVHILEGWFQP